VDVFYLKTNRNVGERVYDSFHSDHLHVRNHFFHSVFLMKRIEQKESQETIKLFPIIAASLLLAVVITAALSFFLFGLLGSASVLNLLFSLKISNSQLLLLVIFFFVYLFTLDELIDWSVKAIVGKNLVHTFVMFLTRIFCFYLIGAILQMKQPASIIISIGIASMIFMYERYLANKKKMDESVS